MISVYIYIFFKAKRLMSISLGVAADKCLFIIIMNNLECMNCKNSQHLYTSEVCKHIREY